MSSEGRSRAEALPERGLQELPKGAWAAVAVLFCLYTISYLDRQIISIMVQPIRAELQISDFEVSLLQGFAFALLYSIAGLPLGWMVDRFSRRWVIFGGVVVWAAAATACGLSRNYGELLAARIVLGAGEAALIPASFAILSGFFPRHRLTLALSIFSVGAVAGISLSWVVGGWILQNLSTGVDLPVVGHVSAWRFAFIATGLPGLGLAFLIFTIPEPSRAEVQGSATRWKDLFRFMLQQRRFFTSHFLGFASIYSIALINLSWLPALLQRRHAWESEQIGFVLGAGNLFFGGIALLFTGKWVDYLVSKGVADAHFRFYVWASVGLFVAAGSFLLPNPWATLACLAVATLALQMGAIAGAALQVVTPPELRGKATAVYLLILSLIGMTLGASLPAAFTDFVFQDEDSIDLSLASSFALLAPLACLMFVLGLKPLRARMAELASGSVAASSASANGAHAVDTIHRVNG